MTDRLIEQAEKWGVETHEGPPVYAPASNERPRLDIAHDLLAKLPLEKMQGGVTFPSPGTKEWHASSIVGLKFSAMTGSFESAVIALAERAGVKP